MVRSKPTLPAGHGELLEIPPYSDWEGLLSANRGTVSGWSFNVGSFTFPSDDLSIAEMRAMARREALQIATAFSARIGVPIAAPGEPDRPIVATGHQPELYHPGVWVKDFLLQRFARDQGATAIDIVVDSDGFESVGITTPCFRPEVRRCHAYLALGTSDGYFAATPVPSANDLDDFCRSAGEQLATLPAPAIGNHFARFCAELHAVAPHANNLAELVTIARRRFEASAGTDYLELPVTEMATSESYLRFAASIMTRADSFAEAYNEALSEYRTLNNIRNVAQPLPDLKESHGGTELPFWALVDGARLPVYTSPAMDGVGISDGVDRVFLTIPTGLGSKEEHRLDALRRSGVVFAPKALALTLFVRMFLADFFIHGVGGGRYDRVTDGIVRRFYSVEPPAFAVASMTMYLPLGAHVVTDDEVAQAKERLNRLEHNPDALLDEVEFDSAEERTQAASLAAEKAALVAEIARPDADKKALGLRIREVNAGLSALLAPLRVEYEQRVADLESQLAANDILTDRGYPFCFWSPEEVADKIL